MIWQDITLIVAGFAFVPALAISIVKKTRIPIGTSLLTVLALTAFVVCYMTLGLYLAAFSTGLTMICWCVLFTQEVQVRWKR